VKIPINDALVHEYAARLRAGGPLGQVFPAPMSECEFTSHQRALIRQARSDRKASRKNVQVQSLKPVSARTPAKTPQPAAVLAKTQLPKALSKLQKLLFLQHNLCFFCGQSLTAADASIEHLNPKSRGGKNTEDNVVVCHKSLNETFGNMDLKRKFAFVLKSAGSFKCPRK
jgi:5-methylcytosine-specific restriction endonuclease McrA